MGPIYRVYIIYLPSYIKRDDIKGSMLIDWLQRGFPQGSLRAVFVFVIQVWCQTVLRRSPQHSWQDPHCCQPQWRPFTARTSATECRLWTQRTFSMHSTWCVQTTAGLPWCSNYLYMHVNCIPFHHYWREMQCLFGISASQQFSMHPESSTCFYL